MLFNSALLWKKHIDFLRMRVGTNNCTPQATTMILKYKSIRTCFPLSLYLFVTKYKTKYSFWIGPNLLFGVDHINILSRIRPWSYPLGQSELAQYVGGPYPMAINCLAATYIVIAVGLYNSLVCSTKKV
jgi:hypothetical protein